MKFTLSWLKDHLETSATLDQILTALTDLGHEVEEVENPEVKPVFRFPDTPPDSQPIRHVGAFRRPVVLGAAESDALVDPRRTTVQLAARLREAGTPVVERLYPRANHVTLVGAFAGPLRWLAPVLDDVAGFVKGG